MWSYFWASCCNDIEYVPFLFIPHSLVAVEYMRQGKSPTEAAQLAMARITKYYPDFSGGLVAVNKAGEYGKN